MEGRRCFACLGFQSHSNFLLPAGKGEADSASLEIIEAKIIKVTPKKTVGCRSTQKPGMVCSEEWRDSKSLSWICPLHSEDLIRVHLNPGEDYVATFRCKCQPGFKPRAGEILSTKSGCPEHTAPGTHVPKRASAATQNIPRALPGKGRKGRNVLAQLLATTLLAPPGSSAQG